MHEQRPFEVPPSQEIDEKYVFQLIEILYQTAKDLYEGWTKLGVFANFNLETKGIRIYTNIVVDGQNNDKWLPWKVSNELAEANLLWLRELMDQGLPLWTSMFFAIDARRTIYRWLSCYDEDYGPWKIHMDKDNWPAMEEALRKF